MDRVYSCASLTLVCAYPVARGQADPCNGFSDLTRHTQARARDVRRVQDIGMMVVSRCVDDICKPVDGILVAGEYHNLQERQKR